MKTWEEIFNRMIEHYTPLLTSIKTMLGFSKTSSLIGASTTFSLLTTILAYILEESFLGVSVLLLVVISCLIIVDQILGTSASSHQAREALLKGDKDKYENHKFKSSKIMFTIFKFMSIYLWLLLSFSASTHVEDIEFFEPIINTLALVPIFLFGLREYVSIGESLEILFGKKPYLFTLANRIFELLQLKFFKKLGSMEEENNNINENLD